MAIVFDTAAELEAFCEAFELRAELQEPIKKSRKKFIESESTIEEPQAVLSLFESPQPIEEPPIVEVDLPELEPIPELLEEYPLMAEAS